MAESLSNLDISDLRGRLLDNITLGVAIAAIPALIISLWRVAFLGFQAFMAVQIVLVIFLWLIWIARKKLSYTLKVSGFLGLLWIASFAALSQLGPVSDSKVFIVLFAFTAMLLLKPKIACILIAAIIANTALLGLAAAQKWLQFDLDYAAYSAHPLPWTLMTWNMGIFSAIVAYIAWRMVNDLSQQSQKAQTLASRHQKIAERVPGVVYQYRLKPDGSSQFPYASDGIEEIYRVSAQQAAEDASVVFEVLHPDDIEEVKNTIIESATHLTPWQMEYRVYYADKSVRWLSGNANPEREADGSILWHGVIMDITQRKNAETIKDEFVSTVSHELRTPLTSIDGALKLLNSGVLESKPEKKKQMLLVAQNNSERLLYLINDLLDIDKLDQGKLTLEVEKVSLGELLEQCVQENLTYAEQYKTRFELHSFEPFDIKVDAQRMKQAITNLMSNACKYSPQDQPVEIRVESDKKSISISIEDHGEGIPDEFKGKIFDKFTQADTGNTRAVAGTGLGLSIAKKIVELHQGAISFSSKPDQGTTFTITLPAISS